LNGSPATRPGALDHASESGSRERRTALGRLFFALYVPKRAQLIANDRVRRRRPLFDATDVQGGGREVDLLPSEIDQLAGPKAVAVGDKHRGIAVAMPIALRGGHELLDLGLGQMLAGTEFAIWWPDWANCSIYDGRCNQLEACFSHEFWRVCICTVRKTLVLRTVRTLASAGHKPCRRQ
jgi:hypothetical protein